MARLFSFTLRVYGLLRIILASLALGMTRGIITLLNFCILQLQYYIDKPNPIIQCQKKWMHFIFKYPKIKISSILHVKILYSAYSSHLEQWIYQSF